jgi:serine/threonine protein kinase
MSVCDFGIAHFKDEELYTAVETAPSSRLANFQYAAPEQKVRGRGTDARTDIYALGLILNEMITGEVPHGAGYRTIAQAAPDLEWLDDVVEQMIQQDPNNRPDAIDEVKRLFQANREAHVTRQRLSEITNTVIPIGEEDDPLALEGPRLIDCDWNGGYLTLVLDKRLTQGWTAALKRMGNHSAVYGKGPDNFRFDGNTASIAADEGEVQRIIDHFKEWLPNATRKYREQRAWDREQRARTEREALELERKELERRRRILNSIRL